MSFAALFKPSAQSVITVAKSIDTNIDKFCSLLADELKVNSSDVKTAFMKSMHVFDSDEKKKKEEEARLKEEKKAQEKLEREKLRDEKKKEEERIKAIQKEEREKERALARETKKQEEERLREEKKKEKEEEKKKKEEEKKKKEEEKKEKKEIKCDDCDKTIRKAKEIDGKSVCSECHKKIEKEIKEKNKVVCSHTNKDGKKCTISATEGDFCKRHAKKNAKGTDSTTSSASDSESKISFEDDASINGFDYSEEPIIPFDKDHDFWTSVGVKIDNIRCRLTKKHGVIFYIEDEQPVFYGIRNGDVMEKEQALSNDVKEWMMDSGLVVKSKKAAVEFEDDLE